MGGSQRASRARYSACERRETGSPELPCDICRGRKVYCPYAQDSARKRADASTGAALALFATRVREQHDLIDDAGTGVRAEVA
jgi:hypothetical protein